MYLRLVWANLYNRFNLNVFIVFNPVPFMGNGRNTLEFLAFDFQDGLEGLEANMSCDKKIIRVDL